MSATASWVTPPIRLLHAATYERPKLYMSKASSGLKSLGVRAKILLVGAIGLIGAIILAGVNFWSLNSMNSVATEIDAASSIQQLSTAIKADAYNIKRIQNRYMLDAYADGAAAATGDSRKKFDDTVLAITKHLQEFATPKTDAGKAALAGVRSEWENFLKDPLI